ncbi:hypothetical protein MPDQ_006261 [Monascus purpureus]|uniref:Uncharacterized protein n=1 Tax=Monascus purpureus TaxID=5098 RepID=A0A507QY83_MONPU|nr:hypothetical protein MPDQ_006261 [Monascus purpureus]
MLILRCNRDGCQATLSIAFSSAWDEAVPLPNVLGSLVATESHWIAAAGTFRVRGVCEDSFASRGEAPSTAIIRSCFGSIAVSALVILQQIHGSAMLIRAWLAFTVLRESLSHLLFQEARKRLKAATDDVSTTLSSADTALRGKSTRLHIGSMPSLSLMFRLEAEQRG